MRPGRDEAPGWLLAGAVLLLFTAWSLSFIAAEALLRPLARPPRFDAVGLTVARFVPAALLCGGYCVLFRAGEALAVLRHRPARLVASGLLCVPAYNLALFGGQQHRVPAPVASFLTTLAPLFVMMLSALVLGERLTARRIAGVAIAVAGTALIAAVRAGGAGDGAWVWVLVTALAPLSWALHTVITKSVSREVSPLLWTYLAIAIGAAPLFVLLPWAGGPELLGLDAAGIGWLAHLVLPCTVLGFALWTWLLRHLPATTVGFTVFLNPPLTTGYKWALSLLFPASFAFAVKGLEVAGGAVLIAGVAVAVLGPRKAPR